MFLDKDRLTYNIKFIFDIAFKNIEGDLKKIKINSTIDLITNNNLSIRKREKVISDTLKRLIKKIDKNVDEQLKNTIFSEFIIAN